MESENFVILSELAKELGMDKSNLRKYVLSKGLSFLKVRSGGNGQQVVLALTLEDAELIRESRKKEGFALAKVIMENGNGYFYLVQAIPEYDPLRIKLGFAVDVNARLQTYRTLSPGASLVASWPCRKSWEIAAMASITREGCKLVTGEVYQCDDLESLLQRGEQFFSIMPK